MSCNGFKLSYDKMQWGNLEIPWMMTQHSTEFRVIQFKKEKRKVTSSSAHKLKNLARNFGRRNDHSYWNGICHWNVMECMMLTLCPLCEYQIVAVLITLISISQVFHSSFEHKFMRANESHVPLLYINFFVNVDHFDHYNLFLLLI